MGKRKSEKKEQLKLKKQKIILKAKSFQEKSIDRVGQVQNTQDLLNQISKSSSKQASEVVKNLNAIILEQLETNPNTPWDNQSYLSSLAAEVMLRDQKRIAEKNLSIALTSVPIDAEKFLFDETKGVIEILEKITQKVLEIRASKLNVTNQQKRPRILRVAEKLELTPDETRILEYIFVNSTKTTPALSLQEREAQGDPLIIASAVGVTAQDMLEFLSPNRTHIKQNMFEYMDTERLLSCVLSLTPEAIMVFAGKDISDEMLLKIDNTIVAEVVLEESPRELRSRSDLRSNENDDGPDDDFDDENDLDEKEEEEAKEGSPDKSREYDDEVPDLHEFLKQEVEAEKRLAKQPAKSPEEEASDKLVPYTSDLDYLETECKHIVSLFQIAQMETQQRENRAYSYRPDFQQGTVTNDFFVLIWKETRLRELRAQARVNQKRCEKRLELTKESGEWLPRIERLVQIRGLCPFERQIALALIGTHVSAELETLGQRRETKVGFLLRAFCTSFDEQIKSRAYFYKNSKLIKEGVVRMVGGTHLDDDLMDAIVSIDRRMLEFALGLDTEFSELVEGSHLYYPKVNLDQVVLPDETKKLILTTVENFEGFKKARKRMGLDESVSYGGGIVMLFFGASGTGKTMMANSIANHMKKKILLINFPSLGKMSAGENLKFIFREAKINDAILFFDECESIFESREKGQYDVNTLLTEIERHDGLIIMATNRAFDLDEAMHRRITLAIEFQKPDPILREQIWKANVPKELVLHENVNFKELAMQFELTGGFIKNAIINALSRAVSRDGEKNACIQQEDLEHGARLQLRGRLRMIDFDHRVVPTRGLESLVLHTDKLRVLKDIISFEKARLILFSQWGFDKVVGTDQATSCLFWGPPGTGKTMAAEAIAFSTGKPLKVINIGELISKWVGETSKNINAIFEEAKAHDAVLVFDEADSLFGTRTEVSCSTDRYANADVGLLLYHMEHFRGVVVLCTNLITQIDQAFFRRMKFVLEFSVPDLADRAKLWQQALPKECPLSSDVDFQRLASKFDFSGGNIKSSVIRAAARAALRENNRAICQADLEQAGKEEQDKHGQSSNAGLYS